MDPEKLLAEVRAKMAKLLTERGTHQKVIDDVRAVCEKESRDPNETEATSVVNARAAKKALDDKIDEVRSELVDAERDVELAKLDREVHPTGQRKPAYDDVARVGREERTYSAEKSARGAASFFADSYGAQNGNVQAAERIQRNLQEAIVEREVSERALTTSSFGGLVVPQYLIDLATQVVRTGRPVANAVTGLELPGQGMTLTVTRGTTGTAVASQATENTAVQNTDEAFTDLTIPVRTLAGQQDVSRQSLERGTPGLDELTFLDLAGAYHAEVDRQVINGSGSSGQMLGILNTSGINAATAYGAAISFANFNLKVTGQVAAIAGQGAGITPRLIVMNPRRWGWLTGLVGTDGRPMFPPSEQGLFNAGGVNANPGGYGGDDARAVVTVGSMQGLPITTDGNVPTNVGAATGGEDVTLVLDPSKSILWEEGDGQPRQLRFEQTLGNQLTVKLVVYGYAAFTAGRYPTASGKTGGLDTTTNGQVAPSF